MREFSLEGAEIELSEKGKLVGHLALGQELVAERAAGCRASRATSCSRCATASSATTARTLPPGGAFTLPSAALQRLNSVDAAVKGALEHGLT